MYRRIRHKPPEPKPIRKFILIISADQRLRPQINRSRVLGHFSHRVATDESIALPLLTDPTRNWDLVVASCLSDTLVETLRRLDPLPTIVALGYDEKRLTAFRADSFEDIERFAQTLRSAAP